MKYRYSYVFRYVERGLATVREVTIHEIESVIPLPLPRVGERLLLRTQPVLRAASAIHGNTVFDGQVRSVSHDVDVSYSASQDYDVTVVFGEP